MSREIKFEYGFNSVNGIVKKKYYLHEIPFMHDKCDVWQMLPVVYVRQFTGLKDKHNKEIYEGDICKHNEDIAEIKYWEGAFIFNKYAIHNYSLTNFACCRTFEVIGNIYENPDLLTI